MHAEQVSFDQVLVSRFPNIKTLGSVLPIGSFIEEVRSGQWRTAVEQLRSLKTENEQQRFKAAKLAAYTLSGTFKDLHSKNGMIAHSGAMVLDFDHLREKGIDPVGFRDRVILDSHVYAACLSPRGNGVKVIIRVEPSKESHAASFARAREYFFEKYGVACDESGKDPSRLCFISHDPDIRVNRNAIVLPIERFQFGPNGAGQALPTPPWPADSILEDLIVYARGFSEADDTILIGSLLPIIPGVLARKVHCWLDGQLFPNLLALVVAPSGLNKSTSIKLTRYIAGELLAGDRLLSGNFSDQSLFDEFFEGPPDKLWIEDDANPLFRNWAHDVAGKLVAPRLLKLHDCERWIQTYRNQKDKKQESGGVAKRVIPQTSLTTVFGSTFATAQMQGIPVADGLRSRFIHYVSEKKARSIYSPRRFDCCEELEAIISRLRKLAAISGEITRNPAAESLYRKIKDDIDRDREQVTGHAEAKDLVRSSLSRGCARILKLAMIFELARWVNNPARDWKSIQPDTLQIAAAHYHACHAASLYQEQEIGREDIDNKAQMIIDTIRSGALGGPGPDGHYAISRSLLTYKFAPHPGRAGAITPNELYDKIMPHLKTLGLALGPFKAGRKKLYAFKGE